MHPPSHLQCCASDTSSFAFALSYACLEATKMQKDGTCSWSITECSPEWLPSVVIVFPTLIAVIRNILMGQSGLAPIKTCCSARFTCWNSTAWVDGMFSNDLLPLVKRWCRASLTPAAAHPLLYIGTTKRSMCCICSDSRQKTAGLCVRGTNISVSSGVLVQAAQARILPHPRNFCWILNKIAFHKLIMNIWVFFGQLDHIPYMYR